MFKLGIRAIGLHIGDGGRTMMLEKTLHTGNVAAAFGVLATTAADLTVCGGAATAISGASSVLAIFKKDKTTHALVEQMGAPFIAAMKASPLSDGAKKLIPQLMEHFPVTEDDIAAGNLVAAQVAEIVRTRIETRDGLDPALSSPDLLDAYVAILTQTLDPVMAAPGEMGPMQTAMLKELLARSDQSGRADKLRDEGITEKAIIRLAQRITEDTEDVGQAWLELQNAMDIAVRVQAEGQMKSNHGDFVDTVLARVAELARVGDLDSANAAIDDALLQADAQIIRLLDSGVEIALLDRNVERAATLLVKKSDILAEGYAQLADLFELRDAYYLEGRDKGNNLLSSLAVALGHKMVARSNTKQGIAVSKHALGVSMLTLGERESSDQSLVNAAQMLTEATKEIDRIELRTEFGLAQMNLGNALSILGKREANGHRLEQAINAYEASLNELTQQQTPTEWATVQMNLGNTLRILSEREEGTDRLFGAVAAYKEALKIRTRASQPRQWALTQMNLGSALKDLGLRNTSENWFDQAVHAFNAALLEFTQSDAPLEWAMTQMNLGNALLSMGQRETGTARLVEASNAYKEALKENTRERVPLDWAMTQGNLANVEMTFYDKTKDTVHLDLAATFVAAAREIFEMAKADHFVAMADDQLAHIQARRP